ncbi:unnamed protein product [Owenia fusiformis]|uniref:Uncharacterized protein n=1 Tax=Owenia fusiformis TaxID=6347 RepID=A0A8S4PW78_OWEFU|nr:unnamed protein product [Owenia fusiformis]
MALIARPTPGFEGFKPLVNEDLNGDSDMDSVSDVASEGGQEINKIDSAKIDPAHREILEKLKRQEREERAEIEEELRIQKEVLARHEEFRAREIRMAHDREREQDLRKHAALDLRDKIQSRPLSSTLMPHGINDLSMYKDRTVMDRPLDPFKSERSSLDMLTHHAAYLERAYPRPSPPPPEMMGEGPAHHWTFEEQFKQLYELSDDPKRREFLDDLFSFMQKRGTPVNRIPIMAKQTLDLYELFKLVVSKGGLVEVINKKLWREITKGLNLPSSITSAAFTLRTQYMKYLYPYECEKLKLSSPTELQSAIDGNRREGRRPSYGYDLSPGAPTLLSPSPHHINGLFNGHSRHTVGTPPMMPPMAHHHHPSLMNGLHHPSHPTPIHNRPRSTGSSDDNRSPSPPSTPSRLQQQQALHSLTERDAIAMEAASRAMEEATRKMEMASRVALERAAERATSTNSNEHTSSHKRPSPSCSPKSEDNRKSDPEIDEPSPKKMALAEDERLLSHVGMNNAHLKITSRSDGKSDFDNSLVISMEINGIMYQGVLFAQAPRRL